MFFLGEIYVDRALPVTEPASAHCGQCKACLAACPTQAIVAPYRLDARRCISYLTIEHAGPIPVELRALLGNRIYGCDDCLLACPWNKFAQRSSLPDFDARAGLSGSQLAELSGWSEKNSRAAPRAAPSAASDMSAGCAISPSAWATRCVPPALIQPARPRRWRSAPRCRPAPPTRASWCASMSPGRWRRAIRPAATAGRAGTWFAAGPADLPQADESRAGGTKTRAGAGVRNMSQSLSLLYQSPITGPLIL